MTRASRNSAVVALGVLEWLLFVAVGNALILAGVDDKLGDGLCSFEVRLPFGRAHISR
jgi:hypothetical protein